MTDTYTTPERAMAAVYRPQPADSFFEGYQPPEQFEHGKPELVGCHPIKRPGGLSSNLFEARYPHSFYRAEMRDPCGSLVATISTGSGRRIGVLLSDLCEAFADAEAHLEGEKANQGTEGRWRKSRILLATPGVEAQDVDVFEHTSTAGWSHVAARPSGEGLKRRLSVNLYLQDPALAERIAVALSEGMLHVQEA